MRNSGALAVGQYSRGSPSELIDKAGLPQGDGSVHLLSVAFFECPLNFSNDSQRGDTVC
jgi:hypothetical protein